MKQINSYIISFIINLSFGIIEGVMNDMQGLNFNLLMCLIWLLFIINMPLSLKRR